MDQVRARISAAILAAATTFGVLKSIAVLAEIEAPSPTRVVVMPRTVITAPAVSLRPLAGACVADLIAVHADPGACLLNRWALRTPTPVVDVVQ